MQPNLGSSKSIAKVFLQLSVLLQGHAEQLSLVPCVHISGCETGHLKLKYLPYLFSVSTKQLLTTGENGCRDFLDYHDLPSLAIDVA